MLVALLVGETDLSDGTARPGLSADKVPDGRMKANGALGRLQETGDSLDSLFQAGAAAALKEGEVDTSYEWLRLRAELLGQLNAVERRLRAIIEGA
jgi:hypothetical protein